MITEEQPTWLREYSNRQNNRVREMFELENFSDVCICMREYNNIIVWPFDPNRRSNLSGSS